MSTPQAKPNVDMHLKPCAGLDPEACNFINNLAQHTHDAKVLTGDTFQQWGAEIEEGESKAAELKSKTNDIKPGTWATIKAYGAYGWDLITADPRATKYDINTYAAYYEVYGNKDNITQGYDKNPQASYDTYILCFTSGFEFGAHQALCEISYNYAIEHGYHF